MGLGKTLMMLSLIAFTKENDQHFKSIMEFKIKNRNSKKKNSKELKL